MKEKARIRLAQLVDPAIAVHAQAMVHAPKWGDRLRAAESVLDRAGYPRRTEVDIDMARAALKARLAADDPVIEMEAIGDGSND